MRVSWGASRVACIDDFFTNVIYLRESFYRGFENSENGVIFDLICHPKISDIFKIWLIHVKNP